MNPEGSPYPPQPGFTKPIYPNLPQPDFAQPPYPQPTTPEIPPPPPYTSEPLQTSAEPVVTLVQPAVNYGPESMNVTCPHCRANISTRVETNANTKTHLIALLCCLMQCWFCLPCVYCNDKCLVKKHYCPSCNQYLGSCEN